MVYELKANAPQFDRNVVQAQYVRNRASSKNKAFTRTALKRLSPNGPEMETARHIQHLADVKRRKENRTNNENWYDNLDGLDGLSR